MRISPNEILNSGKRGKNLWKAIRNRSQRTKRALERSREWMSPGWYRIVGNVAWKIPSKRHDNVKKLYQGILKQSLYGPVTRAVRFAEKITPPVFACLPSLGNQGTGTHLMIPLSHGRQKIFDFKKHNVTSFYDIRRHKLLQKSHQLLDPYYPINRLRFFTHQNRHVVVEDLIDGPNFLNAPRSIQIDVIRILLRSASQALDECERRYWSDEQIEDIRAKYEEEDIPRKWKKLITKKMHEVQNYMKSLPLIPCHLDMHGKNVLIDNDGPKFIDIMTAGYHPPFFDILSLLLNTYTHDSKGFLGELTRRDSMTDYGIHIASGFQAPNSETLMAAFLVTYLSRSHNHIDDWDAAERLFLDLECLF